MLSGDLSRLPLGLYSRLVGRCTRVRRPRSLVRLMLRSFVRRYGVDMSEADRPLEAYGSLLELFTRQLRPGARSIDDDPEAVLAPVDGTLLAHGQAVQETVLQIKGRPYALSELLGDREAAQPFVGGRYYSIFLSPRDYHRVHCPVDGLLTSVRHLPGALFPVNATALRLRPRLLCRNERLVFHIATARGEVALVAVGATAVGRIASDVTTLVTNSGRPGPSQEPLEPFLPLVRGDELCRFEYGSTVVLLIQGGRAAERVVGTPVRVGERIACWSRARVR
jgi:phosphatidylserine decarboxylase